MSERVGRVVVVGGSVAGLAAATGLSPRADEVVVVDARAMPEAGGAPATIAPQGRFPHVLLASGAAALERLAPGFADDLYRGGAVGDDGARRCHWWAAGAVRRSLPDLGIRAPMCSRELVETVLRRHVRGLPNVAVTDSLVVRGLRFEGHRVVGIDADTTSIDADLVIDASGRGSRSPSWLTAGGWSAPTTSRVEVGVTYTALDVRRSARDLGGALFAVVQNTPALARIAVALPAEGDHWKIVLGGYFGDAAPTSRDGFLEFAASLPDPVVRELLDNEWLSEPALHRFPSSQRRHWEAVRRLPAGFAVIGDAVASFNPLYGQGMSAAALQVEALVDAVDRFGTSARLPAAVAAAAAKVVATPWQIATGADFVYGDTTGPRPRGTDLVNRYMSKVFIAAAADDRVNLALTRVQQLLAPPSTLFAPTTVRRVRRAARRASALHDERAVRAPVRP